jgi:uncharacterized membrane protein YcaP (DUF421 family)
MTEVFRQAGYAGLFYVLVILLFRVSGKRLAGQTTTFDLIILISLAVALQQVTLFKGTANALVFVGTVFSIHLLQTWLCLRYPSYRDLVRGRPTRLVCEGIINYVALRAEGLTEEELLAGLRKAGFESAKDVSAAHLEETGQISAVKIT